MDDKWNQLKETIEEIYENSYNYQEICRFLLNYMDILEKEGEENGI